MKKSVYTFFVFVFGVLIMLGMTNFLVFQNAEATSSHTLPEQVQSNAFTVIRHENAQKEISLSFVFPLMTTFFHEQGFVQNQINEFQFYLASYISSLSKLSEAKAFEGVSVTGCKFFEEYDGFGYTIVFDNVSVQNAYFGEDSQDETDQETHVENEGNLISIKQNTSGFFMLTTRISGVFPVSSTQVAGELRMINLMAISSWASSMHLSESAENVFKEKLNSCVFVYDFAMQDSSLESEIMYQSEGFSHNVFVKTFDDIASDNTIVFYMTQANKPVWYASAIVFVLLLMAILFVINAKKNKKKSCKKHRKKA